MDLLAVAAGAFGAHGLEGQVPLMDLAAFRTAAQYHMYHALALLAVAWRAEKTADSLAHNFCRGLAAFWWVLFSFAARFMCSAATGSRALSWLTPMGGMAFCWLGGTGLVGNQRRA